jgi:hypothetical protein
MNVFKPKRKNGTRRFYWITLAFTILLLIAFLTSFLVLEQFVTKPFATVAWDSPVACTTDWYVDNDFPNEKADLDEAVLALPMNVELVDVMRFSGRGSCTRGSEVQLTLKVSPEQINDAKQLGDIVHALVIILDEARLSPSAVLSFSFQNSASGYGEAFWRFDYAQAQVAVNAGLSGVDLYNLGG